MTAKTEPTKKRTTVYTDEGKARRVKSKLALEGRSMSAWVEEQMDAYLAKPK